MLISSVIVNFRTPKLVLKCVHSIIEFGVSAPADIVVVENGSGDDSANILESELPKGVRLVVSDDNRGFSAGINLGVRHAAQPVLLVLNPDTYFLDHSIEGALDQFRSDQHVGLVGLNLVYPSGDLQFSARRFYSALDILARRSPLGRLPALGAFLEQRHLMKEAWASGEAFEADWVMGTGFLIRRDVFDRIGGMDEGYFLYMEDVDLCARVWAAGFRVLCQPSARLVHDHQRSSAAGAFSWAGKMHLKSLMRFRSRFGLPILFPPGVSGVIAASKPSVSFAREQELE